MARALILLLFFWLAFPALAEETCGTGSCCCPAGQCSCGHVPKLEQGCGCQMAPTLPPPTRAQREDLLGILLALPQLPAQNATTPEFPDLIGPTDWLESPPSPPPRHFLLTPA